MRLIDADELLKHKKKVYIEGIFDWSYAGYPSDFVYMVDIRDVQNAPTVDVQDVNRARWDKPSKYYGFKDSANKFGVICSRCCKWADNDFDYCPHCGAEMDGGEYEKDNR